VGSPARGCHAVRGQGTWQLNPDGTMDTTWRIHPGVTWHDGTPFTTADLLFAFQVFKDPELPTRGEEAGRLMAWATAPDAHTLAVHWSAPYATATRDPLLALTPLPRHLLQAAYEQDKAEFVNHPRFSTEFIGLGPYRVLRWEPGSHIEFGRSGDYYRGVPPLSMVILRFMNDPNSMAASILAGEVDVVLPLGLGVSAAREVERRWAGTGHQVLYATADRFEYLRPQLRPEHAEPKQGFGQRAVREAFSRAIDRELLAHVVADGLAPVADSWVAPGIARRGRVETAIPRYDYDPARAQLLLAEADWVRGPDGGLVHRGTGDRFGVLLNSTAGSDTELKLGSIADNWKALGAQPSLYIIPAARVQDAEHRVKLPGVELISHGGEGYPEQFLNSRLLATAANRWGGRNANGYVNPVVDDLIDRLALTIEPARQIELERQLLHVVMADVAMMPLFWRVDPYLYRNGVKGMRGSPVLEATWNMFEWDRDEPARSPLP
jgi:peptide/nickel transport system substrate-binding protein